MTARRVTAYVAAALAVLLVATAVVTFARVRQLDGEAQRLGELWAQDQGNEALAAESNEYFDQARELEDALPLGPVGLAGVSLLAGAVAVAAWPAGRDAAGPDDGPVSA